MPGRQQGFAFVDGNAGHPLGGQHPAPGALPVHLGNVKIGIVGAILAQFRRRRRLETQVHLQGHGFGQGVYRFDRFQAPPFGARRLEQLGHPQEQVDVPVEGSLDARAQHLHRHLAAVVGHRKMHLGDGGGGDGLVVELRKHLAQGAAELGLDGGPRLGAVERRQPVLQLRQVRRHFLAQKVGSRR